MAYDVKSPMKILTWNVLHRVHAETHSEPAIERWPDEAARVRAIAALISKALTVEGVEVALLQEVSGDVLAELRARLPDQRVLDHLYPRVPKKTPSVRDPREHLVVVAPRGAQLLRAQTFDTDPGKGFLMVGLPDGTAVISTHVSWGAKGAAQLALLSQVMNEAGGAICLGGDFNAEGAAVAKAFGAGVVIGRLPSNSPRTRPKGAGGSDIDHLLCRNASLSDVRVLEHDELSDHRPVAATIKEARRATAPAR